MRIPELLSPAGNLKKLKIALEYGADAVYGGVSHFSLRNRSGKEFDFDSFQEGVEYTHQKGKKIFRVHCWSKFQKPQGFLYHADI